MPINVNLCSLDFDHEVSIRTTLLSCILLREICYCLYQRICALLTQTMRGTIEFAVLYKCWKNCWMNLHLSALFAVFLMEKWTGFPKRCFSPKKLCQIFFSIYATPYFFLSCKYQHLCLLKTYQFLVTHEWPSLFSKQFVSLLLDSVFLTGC